MKSSDADILIVPGLAGSGPDHWQGRWESRLKTARWIEQKNWHAPHRHEWAQAIIAAVRAATRPVVLVGHSCGVSAIAHAAEHLRHGEVAGGFLVAPASETAKRAIPGMPADFAEHWRHPLPFPATVIGSATDPYCPIEEAKALAEIWGARFVDAGDSGHLNTESGHGPWPDGLLQFASFLRRLG